MEAAGEELWELPVDTKLERDLTRLAPWEGVLEHNLAGEDAAECGAVELVGGAPLLELALWEPALSWRLASF